jgi:hypothetical protein
MTISADDAAAEDRQWGPPPLEGWWAPRNVSLDGDVLVFEGLDELRRPSPELFLDFVALARRSAPSTSVVEYAKTYGALGLDDAGRPSRIGHATRERVDQWLLLAREADALLHVASALQRERKPDEFALRVLLGQPANAPDEDFPLTRPDPHGRVWIPMNYRHNVVLRANSWLELGSPFLLLRWDHEQPHPEYVLQTGGLFGALALALAAAVTRAGAFATCLGCGKLFERGRRYRYCNSCGLRTAQRDASRRYRARKKGT